jgi:hypothetical protein
VDSRRKDKRVNLGWVRIGNGSSSRTEDLEVFVEFKRGEGVGKGCGCVVVVSIFFGGEVGLSWRLCS